MRDLNRDYKTRDNLLGINQEKYDIVHFDNVTADTLQQLIDNKFADPEETQNDSPTIQAFLEFMKQYPATLAHGYVVSINRGDYRTSIEGLYVPEEAVTPDLLKAFVTFSRNADELDVDTYLRSWWD